MIFRKTIIAAAVAAAAITAVPAQAGISIGFDLGTGVFFSGKMSPRDVRRMLRHYGYHDIDFIDRHGTFYKLTAERHGNEYFMVVNSYGGFIVERHEI